MHRDDMLKLSKENQLLKRLAENGGKRTEQEIVWCCGSCESQPVHLLQDGLVVCGNCHNPQTLIHYLPVVGAVAEGSFALRTRRSITKRVDMECCGRCGHNLFHVYEDGRIICYRCKALSSQRNLSTKETGGNA